MGGRLYFSIKSMTPSFDEHPNFCIMLRKWFSTVLGEIDKVEAVFLADLPLRTKAMISTSLGVNLIPLIIPSQGTQHEYLGGFSNLFCALLLYLIFPA